MNSDTKCARTGKYVVTINSQKNTNSQKVKYIISDTHLHEKLNMDYACYY